MKHNPIKDLELLHCDLLMVKSMMEVIIGASMNTNAAASSIGDSLLILKEFFDNRLELLEEENRKLEALSVLYEDDIPNSEIEMIYKEFVKNSKDQGKVKNDLESNLKNGFFEGFREAYKTLIYREFAWWIVKIVPNEAHSVII